MVDAGAGFSIHATLREGVLELVLEGAATPSEMPQLIAAIRGRLREHRVQRLLLDVRGFASRLDRAEAYRRPEQVPADLSRVAAAIVVRGDEMDRASFEEFIAARAGQTLRLFTSIERAREWLANGAVKPA